MGIAELEDDLVLTVYKLAGNKHETTSSNIRKIARCDPKACV